MKRNWLVRISAFGLVAIATIGLLAAYQMEAAAHCQVPCGIYDDSGRITQLREDATTITKAINAFNGLSHSKETNNMNQATRWVMTKEAHASNIIKVVSEYFLTQKVKPVARDDDGYQAYLTRLADHHAVMVAAMKTKQSASTDAAKALNTAIDKLATHYAK